MQPDAKFHLKVPIKHIFLSFKKTSVEAHFRKRKVSDLYVFENFVSVYIFGCSYTLWHRNV